MITTPAGIVLDGTIDGPLAAPQREFVDDDLLVGGEFEYEVDTPILDFLEFFLLNNPPPAIYRQTAETRAGKDRLVEFGCTTCHVPDLQIDVDRRVMHAETVYTPNSGGHNSLFTTVTPLYDEVDDGLGLPTLKLPRGEPFLVEGIYSDFKRHDLGPNDWGVEHEGGIQKEQVTRPLWGVGSTAPYRVGCRFVTLEEVILAHGGDAQVSRDQFAAAPAQSRRELLEFLKTLVL